VQEDRISTRVDEILEELDDLQHSLDQTHDELLEYKAKAMVSSARSLGGGNVRLVTEVGVTEDIHRLRIIASKIVSFPNMFVVLGHTDDKASLIVARSKNLEYDASVIIRQVCDEFGGGGGGSAMLAQGGGFESGRIAQIIHRVEEIVKSTFD
jgi:alanyl-tRNA synthetase